MSLARGLDKTDFIHKKTRFRGRLLMCVFSSSGRTAADVYLDAVEQREPFLAQQ